MLLSKCLCFFMLVSRVSSYWPNATELSSQLNILLSAAITNLTPRMVKYIPTTKFLPSIKFAPTRSFAIQSALSRKWLITTACD